MLMCLSGSWMMSADATAAKGRVFKIPNWTKGGYKPVRVAVPKGMRYDPVRHYPCFPGDPTPGCSSASWFRGRNYNQTGRVGTASPGAGINGWGFGWVKARPQKCRWEGSIVGQIHVCRTYCVSTSATCSIDLWGAFGRPVKYQIQDLWKPARGGGYLYLAVQFNLKKRRVSTNFSHHVFSDALAIIKHSDRVGISR